MPDVTINGLGGPLATPAADDLIPIWDTSAGQMVKIRRDVLVGAAITGGGTIALGGFTLTVPTTGVAALLGAVNAFTAANTYSALQTFNGQIKTARVQGSAAITLAANEARYTSDWVSGTFGLLIVLDASNGYVGAFVLRGGAGAVVEALDPSGRFSHTSGTTTSINCYYNAGQYWLENKLAGPTQISVLFLG